VFTSNKGLPAANRGGVGQTGKRQGSFPDEKWSERRMWVYNEYQRRTRIASKPWKHSAGREMPFSKKGKPNRVWIGRCSVLPKREVGQRNPREAKEGVDKVGKSKKKNTPS